jgi:N-acetylglucosamine kinase-like BadF-type ATPase
MPDSAAGRPKAPSTVADLVLGVDGGNTKTVAVVASNDGTAVGAGRAGPSDFYATTTEEAAFDAVAEAVDAALAEAGADAGRLRVAVFGMAGADWPEDFDDLRDGLCDRGWCDRLLVVNDAIAALYAGSPAGVGVVLVAGTGMAIGARAASGAAWHSSNWPTAGGGYWLGRSALEAVYAADLGVDPPTSLTERVLAHFGESSVEAVLHRRTARGIVRRPMSEAPLAPFVLDEADAGDSVAAGIVDEFGRRLGAHAVAAARRVQLGPEPFPLILAGGVFRHPTRRYLATMLDRVNEAYPGVRPEWSRFEPVAGAVLLAWQEVGVAPTPALLDRLAASMPPLELFRT